MPPSYVNTVLMLSHRANVRPKPRPNVDVKSALGLGRVDREVDEREQAVHGEHRAHQGQQLAAPRFDTFANPLLAARLRSAASSLAIPLGALPLGPAHGPVMLAGLRLRVVAAHDLSLLTGWNLPFPLASRAPPTGRGPSGPHFICSFMLLICTTYAIAIVITAIVIASAARSSTGCPRRTGCTRTCSACSTC